MVRVSHCYALSFPPRLPKIGNAMHRCRAPAGAHVDARETALIMRCRRYAEAYEDTDPAIEESHVSARAVLVAVAAVLPACGLKNRVLRALGWTIERGASVGPCLVLNVDRVHVGVGAGIGPFNVLRDLASLTLGEYASVGQWNWLTSSRHMRAAGAPATLDMGAHSSIASRHYVDTTGGVVIGSHTIIAGVRSTFITHGISWRRSAQTFQPIEIGDYCLISSNVQVAAGSVVGDRIVVGMGATIAGELSEPGLYIQPRASLAKSDIDGEYFRRERGFVDTT
jgi:UDP-3-O-[3-hydroxymyristoyl] glucosamine N-acyltransferase